MRFPFRTGVPMLLMLAVGLSAFAAEPLYGPVIDGYGPVVPVPEGSYNLVPGEYYRVAMDVAAGPDDSAGINRGIESAARFLNMHARNGIRPEDIELALVLHGGATSAALTDEVHQREFGLPNGSRGLIEALNGAGVRIYLCGQSAGYRGYAAGDLLPQVTLALSAMSAHARLQQEGYQIIPF
jgi:intracellular sulfur oxidation DsrE/DsrF family protein